jgi:ribonuclease P protein component
MAMSRLKKRAEFLAVAKGARSARRWFVLQALAERDPDHSARIGFTVTKKVGNAVVRNRVRRRLKEAARHVGDASAMPGYDYVLIGRDEALRVDFEILKADLVGAFRSANLSIARGDRRSEAPRPGRRDTKPSAGTTGGSGEAVVASPSLRDRPTADDASPGGTR